MKRGSDVLECEIQSYLIQRASQLPTFPHARNAGQQRPRLNGTEAPRNLAKVCRIWTGDFQRVHDIALPFIHSKENIRLASADGSEFEIHHCITVARLFQPLLEGPGQTV